MSLKVEAVVIWVLVAAALWLGRPDLAQPLAMLGTAVVNAILGSKKDRGISPPGLFKSPIGPP